MPKDIAPVKMHPTSAINKGGLFLFASKSHPTRIMLIIKNSKIDIAYDTGNPHCRRALKKETPPVRVRNCPVLVSKFSCTP